MTITRESVELAKQQELLAELIPQYLAAKILPDGSVAVLADLIYTRAICLGLTWGGYTRRFCFADRALADKHWETLQSEDAELEGYTARRPEGKRTVYGVYHVG